MVNRQERRRRWPKLLIGFLVVFVLLWCGYWYAASRVAAAGAGRLVAAFAARGQSLTCAEPGMSGFPLTLDLDCRKAAYSDPKTSISAALAGVSAQAPLYWPGLVTASLAGPLQFEAGPGRPGLTATWAGAIGSAEAGLRGLKGFSANLDGLAVAPDDGAALPFTSFTATHADLAVAPADDDGYRLSLAGSGVNVTLADGTTLPKIGVDADVTALKFGPALGTDPKLAIRAWLAGGGAFRIDRLVVSSGGSSVHAGGNLALSKAGLLSGTLTLRLTGLDQLPDLVEQFKPGSRDKVANALSMVSAVAKPVQQGNETAYQIPLAVMNGTVSVGGIIPIATIPPVKF